MVYIIAILYFACFSSCYKDKGNYSYQTIDDIAIVMADSTAILYGNKLNITPTINQATAKDEGHLKYEWSVNQYDETVQAASPQDDSTIIVLSNNRNLDTLMNFLPAQSAPYSLNYKVIDTVTGITYRKPIRLLVYTPYQVGWMVLEQIGGGADMSFINTLQDTTYHKAYSSANPAKPLPANTNIVYSYNIPGGNDGAIFYKPQLFCGVLFGNGGYAINGANMQALANYTTLFANSPATVKPQFMMREQNSADVATINNGKFYRRFYTKGQQFFADAFTASDGLDYYLAPYNAGMFFDTLNHRFLQEKPNTSILEPLTSQPYYVFDPNNMRGLKVLAFQRAIYGKRTMLAKSNNSDSCFLYSFFGTNPISLSPVLNSPGVERSPSYAFTTTRNQMYYVIDNNLYLYDISAGSASVVYSFPEMENISLIQLQDDQNIILATFNGSTGNIYFFSLDDTGSISNGTYTNQYTGFGKVVGMSYHN